jgi:chromate transport protein ChrA
MVFCLAQVHAGIIPALFVFLLWSLPGAVGMFALSLGVRRMNEILPDPVYALLSGLNASTVGIIALAAVQLAEKCIRDRLTRIQVIAGACAGLCYNSLWYFPVLIVIGGLVTVVWDGWMSAKIGSMRRRWKEKRRNPESGAAEEMGGVESVQLEEMDRRDGEAQSTVQKRNVTAGSSTSEQVGAPSDSTQPAVVHPAIPDSTTHYTIRVKIGIALVVIFFGAYSSPISQPYRILTPPASFITILVLRSQLTTPPLELNVFANMYLAGTVIFGGGPVVIPLLRSYVVDPGYVSPRDFLIGLAIIQAFPGPNFNFAVYLGALALQSGGRGTSVGASIVGAILGFLGIFVPGLTLAVAAQSFWRVLRRRKWVTDLLRGINATAVGLVFTAVYRLWEIGYLTKEETRGRSLASEPWWVVVAAVTYSGSKWFGVPPALAILSGAVLGVAWWGAVGR